MEQEYLNNDINIIDGVLYSSSPNVSVDIMSIDEDLIMEESANILCQNKGTVLNIGFGLGVIDNYIKRHNPKEHHIIEIHPKVYDLAIQQGFNKIAKLYLGDWQDIIQEFILKGKKFDAIYFDTYTFSREKKQWAMFGKIVNKILNPNGIFSYFNNIASKSEKIEDILENLKWEKNKKYIPYSQIIKRVKRDKPMIAKRPYELIWYKK
jgi:protein arginine N-methyltransferase 2